MSRYSDLIPAKTTEISGTSTTVAPTAPKSLFSDLIPAGSKANTATPKANRYTDLIPKAPVTPPPAPSTASKIKDSIANGVDTFLTKENNFITPPTQEDFNKMPVGTPQWKYTLKYLPSEIARNLPIVGQLVTALQDNPELINYMEPKDFVKAVPGALLETGKQLVKAPVRLALGAKDAVTGNPTSTVNIPGLGEASSPQKTVMDRINAGEDPVIATISEGSNVIFDTLFFAGVAEGLRNPRPTITAETTVDATPFLKPEAIDRATPRSFRLYQEKVSATPLPPEAIARMKQQGVEFGQSFDPSRPTYFRMSYDPKGQTFKGQVVQLKPSWIDTVKNKFKNNPAKAPDEAFLTIAPPREVSTKQIQEVAKNPTKAVETQQKQLGTGKQAPTGETSAPANFGRYGDLVKTPGSTESKKTTIPVQITQPPQDQSQKDNTITPSQDSGFDASKLKKGDEITFTSNKTGITRTGKFVAVHKDGIIAEEPQFGMPMLHSTENFTPSVGDSSEINIQLEKAKKIKSSSARIDYWDNIVNKIEDTTKFEDLKGNKVYDHAVNERAREMNNAVTELHDSLARKYGNDTKSLLERAGIIIGKGENSGVITHQNLQNPITEKRIQDVYNYFAQKEGKGSVRDLSFGSNPDTPFLGMNGEVEGKKIDENILDKTKVFFGDLSNGINKKNESTQPIQKGEGSTNGKNTENNGGGKQDTGSVKEKAPAYKGSGGGGSDHFSMGTYKDGTPVELAKMDGINPIEFPELVDLARELMGNVPLIKKMRAARGKFRAGMGEMEIVLDPELFTKDPEHVAKTLAHEIGHLIDYLPDHSMDKGNIIGRLKVLNNFMKEAFGSEGALDIAKIRAEATKEARKEMNLKPAQEPPYPQMLKDLIKKKVDEKVTEQGGIQNSKIREELKAVTQYWKPFDEKGSSESYVRYRYSSKELYADAISVLFNSPGTLERMAPTFYKEFFDGLDKKPAVFNAYFDLQSILGGDREALIARRREGVRKMFDTGDYKAAELQKAREAEKKERDSNILFKLKFELIDKNQAVIDRINQAQKEGKFISDDENPLYYLEERNYLGGKIKAIMEQDFNPIYKDVQKAGITWTDFGESLFYDRISSGDRSDFANPRGITPDAAKELDIALYKSLGIEKGDALDGFKTRFREAMQKIADEAFKEGLYTPEMYAQMKDNPAYATFQVMDYIDRNMSAKIHKSVGTLKDVTNPADATLMKMVATVKAIERNKVTRNTVAFLQKQFPSEVKKADTRFNGKSHVPVKSMNNNEELVTHMVQGKQVGHYVDPYIAKSLQNETVGQNLAVTKVLGSMNTHMFRPLFIGYNLGFQSFNFIRDFLRFYKNVPGLTFTRAIGRYIQATPVAKIRAFGVKDPEALHGKMKKAYDDLIKLEKEQVLSVTFNDILSGEDQFDRQIDRIMANSGIDSFEDPKANIFLRPFIHVLETIKRSGDFIETLPKVAGFYEISESKGGELSREDKSFIRKNIGSPDFLAGGHLKPFTNEVFLFSNAITQGIRSDVAMATDPRYRSGYWWKTAKINLLPKFLMLAAAIGLFGEEVKKMYEDVSEYDSTNYTIVPLGVDENGKTIYFRLPQDEGGRFVGGMLWKGLHMTQNDQTITNDLSDIFSFTAGNVPSVAPTVKVGVALADYLSGQNPYDTFRNRNILTDDQYKAGGKYALKPFLGWVFNELGGAVFYRFTNSSSVPKDQSSAEKMFNLPVVGNIIGRFVKVSDYGTTEKLNKIKASVQQEQSARRIDENAVVNKYIEEAKGVNAKMRMNQIKKEMINEVFGGEPKTPDEITRAKNLVAKWQIGIQKGSASPELGALISAQSNEEKIMLIQEIKKRLSIGEYEQLKKDALHNKITTPEVFGKAEHPKK